MASHSSTVGIYVVVRSAGRNGTLCYRRMALRSQTCGFPRRCEPPGRPGTGCLQAVRRTCGTDFPVRQEGVLAGKATDRENPVLRVESRSHMREEFFNGLLRTRMVAACARVVQRRRHHIVAEYGRSILGDCRLVQNKLPQFGKHQSEASQPYLETQLLPSPSARH